MTKITLSYEWWEADFEVDLEKAAPACKESLDFFGDPIKREDDSPLELVKAFLQFWGPTLIDASVRRGTESVIEYMSKEEGIYPLDGSHGVKLANIESWRFEPDDFQVRQNH